MDGIATLGISISTFVLGVIFALSAMIPGGMVSDVHYLPPCPTEDSDNCYWSGAVNGNHIGRSFVVIDGKVYYAED